MAFSEPEHLMYLFNRKPIYAAAIAAFAIGLTQIIQADDKPGTPAPKSKSWEVEGVMSDACQCAVFCPCEFNSKPSFGHCDDAAILHIDKGHYGDLKLDGLRVAVVSQSPEGERLVDTVGRLNFARIFVPDNSSDEQMAALAQISRQIFGALVTKAARISPDEKVAKVPMEVTIEPNRHRIKIPNVLDLDVETLAGGDGKTPMVVRNSPFAAAGFGDVLVAHSTVYRYTFEGKDWDYAGRSASIRTFKLSGEIP